MDTLNKILLLMKQKKMSNTSLASYLGISASQISNWKSGNNTSYLKYISQIADYFNVSTDYLLGNDNKKSPSQLSEEELELYNAIKSLTPEQQQLIKSLVESYSKE